MSNASTDDVIRKRAIANIRLSFDKYFELYATITEGLNRAQIPEKVAHVHLSLDMLQKSFEKNIERISKESLEGFEQSVRTAYDKLSENYEEFLREQHTHDLTSIRIKQAIGATCIEIEPKISARKHLYLKVSFETAADAANFKKHFSGIRTPTVNEGRTVILSHRRAIQTLLNLNLSNCLQVLDDLHQEIITVKVIERPTQRIRALAGADCSSVELDVDTIHTSEMVLKINFKSNEGAHDFQKTFTGEHSQLEDTTVLLNALQIERLFSRYKFRNGIPMLDALNDELNTIQRDEIATLNRLFFKKPLESSILIPNREAAVLHRNKIEDTIQHLQQEIIENLIEQISTKAKALRAIEISVKRTSEQNPHDTDGIAKLEEACKVKHQSLKRDLNDLARYQKIQRLFAHLKQHIKDESQINFIDIETTEKCFKKLVNVSNAPQRIPRIIIGSALDLLRTVKSGHKILLGIQAHPESPGDDIFKASNLEASLCQTSDLYFNIPRHYPSTKTSATVTSHTPSNSGLGRLGHSYRVDNINLYQVTDNAIEHQRDQIAIAFMLAPNFDIHVPIENLKANLELARYCNNEGRDEYVHYMAMQIRLLCEHAIALKASHVYSTPLASLKALNNPFLIAAIYKAVLSESRYQSLEFDFIIPETLEGQLDIGSIFDEVFNASKPEIDAIIKLAKPFEILSVESHETIEMLLRNKSLHTTLARDYVQSYATVSSYLERYLKLLMVS